MGHAVEPPEVVAGAEVGWRRLTVDWASGEGAANPPFTSSWEDLDAATLAINLRDAGRTLLAFRLWADASWILAGSNRHSGYDQIGGEEIYRSDNQSDEGWQWRFGAEMGVHLRHDASRLCLTPVAGYLTHRLELSQTEGVQVVPDSGPYGGLDSRTETHWHGPLVGVDAAWQLAPGWSVLASGRYAWLDFSGNTDWNLRTDLEHPVSLEQDGNARAVLLSLAVHWSITRHWICHLRGGYEYWHTTSGRDRVRVVGGPDDVAALRSFEITALALALGCGWRF